MCDTTVNQLVPSYHIIHTQQYTRIQVFDFQDMMAPPRGTKRKSDESASSGDQVEKAQNMTEYIGATRKGSPSFAQESPRKRQRTGISLSQKQALIDNLQLESTFTPLGE